MKEIKRITIETLKELKERNNKGCQGICRNFSTALSPKTNSDQETGCIRLFEDAMGCACKSWSKFSGESSFPIPGGEVTYYHHKLNNTLWVGE